MQLTAVTTRPFVCSWELWLRIHAADNWHYFSIHEQWRIVNLGLFKHSEAAELCYYPSIHAADHYWAAEKYFTRTFVSSLELWLLEHSWAAEDRDYFSIHEAEKWDYLSIFEKLRIVTTRALLSAEKCLLSIWALKKCNLSSILEQLTFGLLKDSWAAAKCNLRIHVAEKLDISSSLDQLRIAFSSIYYFHFKL
jgi:hypothetical protein